MSAVISPCGTWRYRLDRQIDMLGLAPVAFCLHNPSTADAELDDPTSRRGIGFARTWGFSRLIFVNPWAARATKSADLWRITDPVGPENDAHLSAVAAEVAGADGLVIMAFGNVKPPASSKAAAFARIDHVVGIFRKAGARIKALGVNGDGSPKHPLYLRSDVEPVDWPFGAPMHRSTSLTAGREA